MIFELERELREVKRRMSALEQDIRFYRNLVLIYCGTAMVVYFILGR